jgi:hypothetical protein
MADEQRGYVPPLIMYFKELVSTQHQSDGLNKIQLKRYILDKTDE